MTLGSTHTEPPTRDILGNTDHGEDGTFHPAVVKGGSKNCYAFSYISMAVFTGFL
jgi:hypothetical protein